MIVQRDGRNFAVRTRFDVEEVFEQLAPGDRDVRLRLRVVWNNASWETTLARPSKQRAPIELNYTSNDTLLISRRVDETS